MSKLIRVSITIVGSLVLLAIAKSIITTTFRNYYVGNPANCEKMRSNRDSCFNSAAQIKKDPLLCEKISVQSGDYQSDSRDNCYSNVAELTLSPDLCNNIHKISGDGSRDTCFNNIAAKTKNVELCNKMTSQSTTVINGGEVYVDKDFCIQIVATEKLDASLCDRISQKIHQQSSPLHVSAQSCYAFVGQNSKNVSLCDQTGELKTSCLEGAKQ